METNEQTVLDELVLRYPKLEKSRQSIWEAFVVMRDCLQNGHKLVLCGNGGSCADCDHITGELLKGFCADRALTQNEQLRLQALSPEKGAWLAKALQRGLCAVNLCANTAVMTAIANDTDANLIFAQQIMGLGQAGDVLVCVCPKGGAENVLNAIVTARLRQMPVIGLTAAGGGKMKNLCDVLVAVAEDEVYLTQELHLPVYHALCRMLEICFFVK